MGPHAQKAKAAPRSPLMVGKFEPTKITKPQRNRVYRVKQGRRPKLSASQKRKLVRLYIFTTLPWKAVTELVNHYGDNDIKLRALQYLLLSIFGAQYNQLRPKNESEMRDRFRQIQGCRRPILTTVQGNETPQPVVSRHPSATESTKPTIDSLAISLSDPVPAFTDPGHATVLKDDESYLDLFDLFTNNDGSEEIDKSLLDTGHHLLSPVVSIGLVEPHPSSPFRADCGHVQSTEAADQINTGLPKVSSVFASFDIPDASQMLPLVLTPFDVGSDWEIENSAALDEGLPFRRHINSCSSEKMIRKRTRVDLQLPTLQGQSEDSTLLENTTMISSYAQDNRKSSKDSADDLSPLIDRLSNSSLSQKKLIKDILTVSSHYSSTRSCGSSICSMGSSSLSLETLMARVRSKASENIEISEPIAIEADTTINQRNARGETALHLSVKLGNVNATKALLRSGANVHARDSRGRGILAVAERAQRRGKDDESLYARIGACMALAIDSGAVAVPVVIEERHTPTLAQTREESTAPIAMKASHWRAAMKKYESTGATIARPRAVAAPVVIEERHMPTLAQTREESTAPIAMEACYW